MLEREQPMQRGSMLGLVLRCLVILAVVVGFLLQMARGRCPVP